MPTRVVQDRLLLQVLLLLPLVGIWTSASAQFLAFDRSYGGANDDGASDMIPATDGGYLIIGSTGSYGPGASDQSRNGYLLKIDEAGEPLWSLAIGASGDDFFAHAAPCSNGDYLVSGTQRNTGTGDHDLTLTRVTADGAVLWAQRYGTPDHFEFGGKIIPVAPDEFVVIAKRSFLGSGIDGHVLVLRVNADGEQMWTAEFAGDVGDSSPRDIIWTGDGRLLITGTQMNGPQARAVLLALDLTDGSLIWGALYAQPTGQCGGSAILNAEDGGCYVLGSGGEQGLVLSRFDPTGQPVWQRGYSMGESNYGHGLLRTTDGGFVACGTVLFPDFSREPKAIYLLDPVGHLLDHAVFGADSVFYTANTPLPTSSGEVLLCGGIAHDINITRLPILSGGIVTPCDAIDLAVDTVELPPLTISPSISQLPAPVLSVTPLTWSSTPGGNSAMRCSNVGLQEPGMPAILRCFPNPAQDMLNLDLPRPDAIELIQIFDISGKLCLLRQHPVKPEVAITCLNAGSYCCRILLANGQALALPFVVE